MNINFFIILSLRVRNFPPFNISPKFLYMTLTQWLNVILSHSLNVSRMNLSVYSLSVMPTFSRAQQNLPANILLWKMNIPLSYSITNNSILSGRRHEEFWFSKTIPVWFFAVEHHVFEKSITWTNNLHCFVQRTSSFFYTQMAKWSAISSTGTITAKPHSKCGQENYDQDDIFARLIFFISLNWRLQFGHSSRDSLQVQHTLCPFP